MVVIVVSLCLFLCLPYRTCSMLHQRRCCKSKVSIRGWCQEENIQGNHAFSWVSSSFQSEWQGGKSLLQKQQLWMHNSLCFESSLVSSASLSSLFVVGPPSFLYKPRNQGVKNRERERRETTTSVVQMTKKDRNLPFSSFKTKRIIIDILCYFNSLTKRNRNITKSLSLLSSFIKNRKTCSRRTTDFGTSFLSLQWKVPIQLHLQQQTNFSVWLVFKRTWKLSSWRCSWDQVSRMSISKHGPELPLFGRLGNQCFRKRREIRCSHGFERKSWHSSQVSMWGELFFFKNMLILMLFVAVF